MRCFILIFCFQEILGQLILVIPRKPVGYFQYQSLRSYEGISSLSTRHSEVALWKLPLSVTSSEERISATLSTLIDQFSQLSGSQLVGRCWNVIFQTDDFHRTTIFFIIMLEVM